MSYDAIVLAGGTSRRMGGGDKTALAVGNVPLLDRVLAALAGASVRVVVGEPRATSVAVTWTREEPPGGGPVAALAAGLPLVSSDVVVVLAGDLPFLDAASVATLVAGVAGLPTEGARDGAVAADESGAAQWLCGAWRTASLRRLVGAAGPVEGLALRRLLAGASYDIIRLSYDGAVGPWFDVDTPDDLVRAKEHG